MPCTPGACPEGSIELRDASDQLKYGFLADGFHAHATDESAETGDQVICLDMTLTDGQVADIRKEFEVMSDLINTWTQEDFNLQLDFYEDDEVMMDMTPYGPGVYAAPWNLDPILRKKLDYHPDFTYIVHNFFDPVKNLRYGLWYCGLSFGADWGILGAGWSVVPVTSDAVWFECANHETFTHELLHQIKYAYDEISGFDDYYDHHFPPCGEAVKDSYLWMVSLLACFILCIHDVTLAHTMPPFTMLSLTLMNAFWTQILSTVEPVIVAQGTLSTSISLRNIGIQRLNTLPTIARMANRIAILGLTVKPELIVVVDASLVLSPQHPSPLTTTRITHPL